MRAKAIIATFSLLFGLMSAPNVIAASLPPLEWHVSGAATLRDGILEVNAPPESPGGGASARFDLRPLQGKSFRLTVRASMQGVSRPKNHWEGLKFQFSIYDRLIRQRSYPEDIRLRFGDMAETTLELRYDASAHDADEADLFLGLQKASGRARFDLRTLAIEETPSAFTITNQDYIVRYPAAVAETAIHRGVMSPGGDMTEDDFRTLHSWGATLLRFQMTHCPPAAVTNVPAWRTWLNGRLDHLERVILPLAGKYGMLVVVDLHGAPGGRNGHDWRLFDDDVYFKVLLDAWRDIATRFKGDRRIYGYDFVNEPFQTRPHKRDYWQVQNACAKAIRAIDPGATLIVESNHMDAPYTFSYLSPLAMDNVIYEVHMYDPGTYTHQGVGPSDPLGQTYPGVLAGGEVLDKEWLRRRLEPVRAFQKKHKCRIYVGEFSAIAWAPGADAYIRDCIDLFEEYGWDWTYHAFREWKAWSVEHDGPDRDHMVPSPDNPRKRALLEGLRK